MTIPKKYRRAPYVSTGGRNAAEPPAFEQDEAHDTPPRRSASGSAWGEADLRVEQRWSPSARRR